MPLMASGGETKRVITGLLHAVFRQEAGNSPCCVHTTQVRAQGSGGRKPPSSASVVVHPPIKTHSVLSISIVITSLSYKNNP